MIVSAKAPQTKRPPPQSVDNIPHDHEAEVCVLGSMILDGDVVPDVVAIVQADHFFEQRHRAIFVAILDLYQATGVVDVVQLKVKLKSAKQLAEVGGIEYLAEVASSVPSAASATHYAQIVRDKALLRDLIEAGEGITKRGYESGANPAEQVVSAEAAIVTIARDAAKGTGPPLRCVRMSDVQAEDVEMLWPGRIPLGKLAILAGVPGTGKTMLACDMAARVTTGRAWPDDHDTPNPVGDVLLLSCEDGLADTIRPRLDHAEANADRIIAIQGANEPQDGGIRPFDAVRDLRHLDELITTIGNVRLVIVDPLSVFIGPSVDTHRENETRAALSPLADLAQRHQVAVLALMHLSKSKAQTALDRVLGSVAFTAVARAVWMLTRDPDDRETVLLACGKMNLCQPGETLGFTIMHPGYIAWHEGTVDADADDLLNHDNQQERPAPKRDAAKQWLENLLLVAGAEGALATTVEAEAEEMDHAWSTVKRAAKELAVVKTNGGIMEAPWRWFAKAHAPTPDGPRSSLVQSGPLDREDHQAEKTTNHREDQRRPLFFNTRDR